MIVSLNQITYNSSVPEQRQSQSLLGVLPCELLKQIFKFVSRHQPSLIACASTCRKFYALSMPLVRSRSFKPCTSFLPHGEIDKTKIWIWRIKGGFFVSSLKRSELNELCDKPLQKQLEACCATQSMIDKVLSHQTHVTRKMVREGLFLYIELESLKDELQRLRELAGMYIVDEALGLRHDAYFLSPDQLNDKIRRITSQLNNPQSVVSSFVKDILDQISARTQTQELSPAESDLISTASFPDIHLHRELSFQGFPWKNTSCSYRYFSRMVYAKDEPQFRDMVKTLEAIAKGLQTIEDNLKTKFRDLPEPVVVDNKTLKGLQAYLKHILSQLSSTKKRSFFYGDEITYCSFLIEYGKEIERLTNRLRQQLQQATLKPFCSAEHKVIACLRHLYITPNASSYAK